MLSKTNKVESLSLNFNFILFVPEPANIAFSLSAVELVTTPAAAGVVSLK